jgi:hypothetical protein
MTQEDHTSMFRWVLPVVIGLGGPGTSWAHGPLVRIPGQREQRVARLRFEQSLVILETENGRLFSVPLDTPGLELFLSGEAEPRGSLSIQDILDLLAAGVSEETLAAQIDAEGTRYALSKIDLLALERAGASDGFVQFLIGTGRRRSGSGILVIQGSVYRAETAEAPPSKERSATERAGYPFFYPYYPVGVFIGHPPHPPSPTVPPRPETPLEPPRSRVPFRGQLGIGRASTAPAGQPGSGLGAAVERPFGSRTSLGRGVGTRSPGGTSGGGPPAGSGSSRSRSSR